MQPFDSVTFTGHFGTPTEISEEVAKRAADKGAKYYHITRQWQERGGNITISLRDLLYLQRSSLTTSVNGALGSGGNITIDLCRRHPDRVLRGVSVECPFRDETSWPQSWPQVEQSSGQAHTPSPPPGHAPQSWLQVEHVSPW